MDNSPVLPASAGGSAPPRPKLLDARGRLYEPAVSPRLKILLAFIFAGVALLGATGAYLAAVRLLDKARAPQSYTNQFTLWMFIAHILVGVLILGPFLFFGFAHYASARHRKNRLAVRLGLALFFAGILVGATGLALIQLEGMPQLPTSSWSRLFIYALHVIAPLAAVGLYVLHRRAGPDLQWKWGAAWGVAVGVFVLAMIGMHTTDPRGWYQEGPKEGELYFKPSEVHTANGNFIPAQALMMDSYCLKCHPSIYNNWFHSAHHFSSFNNPPYLFSVRETRRVSLKRDGNIRPSRWCAGCHDPVPFLSGAFDDPNFDDVNHPTAQAGITCTACHAITNVDSTEGNAAYTIEEPQHYPFAYSDNPLLQWLNNQVVKAKPDFHKKTFLKPFHRTAEFCSTCHKVRLPMELNHYKEFLRGQDHYNTYLLSGVSGHGARSFYYPPQAKTNCAECHMPLAGSSDFGRKDFDGSGTLKVHSHLFPGANTGLPSLLSLDPKYEAHGDGLRETVRTQADFLRGNDAEGKDRKLRIDLFGLREGASIDGRLTAPLRPELPRLRPGGSYVVEVVIRTLNMGHPFPQGTADSNEIWVDFLARSGERVIGRSGALDGPNDTGRVDEWSHFVNVLLLDRNGNRIDRRNPQDIFTPLYDHQIPPGAAQVIHYQLKVPEDAKAAIDLKVRLRYRKFDFEYMRHVYGSPDKVPALPVVDLCEDHLTLPVAGVGADLPAQASPIQPAWQRWNDYGIGLFLAAESDPKKPGLLQAEEAFQKLTTLDDKQAQANGYLNLARVYHASGSLPRAVEALQKIRTDELPAPWWTVAWFNGLVNAENGFLDEAIKNFEDILDPAKQPRERKFDFTRDFVVINRLGKTLFDRAKEEQGDSAERTRFLRRAVEQYERTLQIDSEDLMAHYGLYQCYERLGEPAPVAASGDSPALDEPGLAALGNVFADVKAPRDRRLQAAAQLGRAVAELGKRPSRPEAPKLPALKSLTAQFRKLYQQESDPALQAAAAHVLGRLYREAHAIYQPDENAKDETVEKYRRDHPAAARASFAIVIYPLNRPGTPGS